MKEALFDRVARFYDYELGVVGEGFNDVPLYADYAAKAKGEVLELACGTGRALIPLARKGFRVTGLDISDEMLKIARSKVRRLSKAARQRIRLIHGDMTGFHLGRRFGLIFIAFRSFQHLLTKRDQGRCLDCVRRHLVPNGYFVLHLFAPRHDLLAQGHRSIYLGSFYDPLNRCQVFRRAEDRYNLKDQTLHEDRFYEWTDRKGILHRHIWSFDFAYLFRFEAELLLEKHGFKIESVFGDFRKSPYNYYSGEQVFVARPAKSDRGMSKERR